MSASRHIAPPAKRRFGAHLVLGTLLVLFAGTLAAAPRVALVIGNGAYPSTPLKNPRNDAVAMARVLQDKLGFQVESVLDGDEEAIKRALAEFSQRLAQDNAVGFFYFSGHGVRVGAHNYLLPLGRRFNTEPDVELFALDVQKVLDGMERAGNALNIVVLDACRDYPLAREHKSTAKGLARIEAPPPGSVIAFATAAGATADDNPKDGNGLYTKHLLKRLAQPGRRLEDVFNAVGTDVWRESQRRQRPELLMTLLDPERPFYFLPAASLPPIPPTPPVAKETYPPGKIFRDCADCPDMVVIPAGEFRMGSPESEKDRDKDEGPRHKVVIARKFALGRTEVTVGEFRRFVEASGYRTSAEQDAAKGCVAWDKSDNKWNWRAGLSWREPGYAQTDKHPVACASWEDARAYVKWLAKEAGQDYRLPSEAEWEYAARAGTTTARPWGEDPDQACSYANLADRTFFEGYTWGDPKHACSDGYWFAAPVGSFQANALKLQDMIGNVLEWVQDCYHDSYSGAPTDGSAWETGKCEARVLRGGSWYLIPLSARSAVRFRSTPSGRFDLSGFRLARTLP